MARRVSTVATVKVHVGDAQLTGARLTGAQLTGARLTGAQLTGARLTGAQLTGERLTGAQLTGARLTGAQLTGERQEQLQQDCLGNCLGVRITNIVTIISLLMLYRWEWNRIRIVCVMFV